MAWVTSRPANSDLLAAIGAHPEGHVHTGGKPRMAIDIRRVEPPLQATVSHQPVKRATVQKVPAHALCHRPADRAFSRAARPVDRHDRGRVGHAISICRPAARAISTKPGKEVATFATSRISMALRATSPATANAMAMR